MSTSFKERGSCEGNYRYMNTDIRIIMFQYLNACVSVITFHCLTDLMSPCLSLVQFDYSKSCKCNLELYSSELVEYCKMSVIMFAERTSSSRLWGTFYFISHILMCHVYFPLPVFVFFLALSPADLCSID